MTDIPPQAITAAAAVLMAGGDIGAMLAAAAPYLARAERERCAALLLSADPLEFLLEHGLEPGAGTARVLAAAADEITGNGSHDG